MPLIGCGDADADPPDRSDSATQSQQVEGEECEPEDGYDECSVVAIEDMIQWDEDDSFPWREVEVDDDNNEVDVYIDADALNDGAVPMDENTGVYESEEEFEATQKALLGVSEFDEEEWDISVHQDGYTHRIFIDEEEETVEEVPGFDDFMADWLTTPDGTVIIGGEQYEVASHEIGDFGDETYSSSTTTASSTFSSDDPVFADMGAGNWTAILTLYQNFGLWTQFTASRINTFQRDGKETYRECGGFLNLFCEKHKIVADEMELYNQYYNSYGQDIGDKSKFRSAVSRIKLGRLGSVPTMCTTARVEDSQAEDIVHEGLFDDNNEYVNCD